MDISGAYLGGLFDACAACSLEVKQVDGMGVDFDVSPLISIRTPHTVTRGIFEEVLNEHRISYGYDYSPGGLDDISIESLESILRLGELVEDETRINGGYLSFVRQQFEERHQPLHDRTPQSFFRLHQTLYELSPSRGTQRGMKYTPEYFESELGVPTPKPYTVRSPQVPAVTAEYAAGLFDGKGRFDITVAPVDDYDIGYSLRTSVKLNRGHYPTGRFEDVFEFFSDNYVPMQKHRNGRSDRWKSIGTSKRDSITSLIVLLEDDLLRLFPDAFLYGRSILPAMAEGVHRTREGLVELLQFAEHELDYHDPENRTYNSDYLVNEWGLEIT